MSVASVIQGESNGTPESMFAVATTIYNRAIQSGLSPEAVVNVPNAFCCQNGNSSSMAQTFAGAINDGTLGNFGTIGNATSFRTAGSNTGIANSGAPNIGGNQFSDNDAGAPTSNFIPPQFNGGSSTVDNTNTGNGDFGGSGLDPGTGIAPGDATTTANAAPAVDTGSGSLMDNPVMMAPFTGGLSMMADGLTYAGILPGKETNVTGTTMAKSAFLAGVPDVAGGLKSVAASVNGITAQIGAQVSKTIADAEAYGLRGFVMFFAIAVAVVAIWLLVPRDTKQRIYSTGATVAKAAV